MADDNRVREFSFSSEQPVERWFGKEILDHSPRSVRMDFIKSGRAPLLLGHDQRTVLGVVTKAEIKGKMGRGAARFGRTQDAMDALMNIDDGIMTCTSVGYRVHGMTLHESDETGDTYRVDDWEPLEVSPVGIPADQTVGFGRESGGPLIVASVDVQRDGFEVVLQQLEAAGTVARSAVEHQAVTELQVMDETPEQKAARVAAEAAKKLTPEQIDAMRMQAIGFYCEASKIPDRIRQQMCQDGTSLEEAGKVILEIVRKRGELKPTAASDLGLSTAETQRYSLFKAIRALRYGGQNPKFNEEAAYELETSRAVAKKLGRELSTSILIPGEILRRPISVREAQHQRMLERALAISPGSKGGYLVETDVIDFITILRNRSVCMRMGAVDLGGLTANAVFPRQTGKPSVTWQAGDGSSTTAADQTFGQLSMTPKTAIVITDVSEQLVAQSSPAVEGLVMADLAADIAIDGVDNAAINGTGGAQPLGIKNTTGITTGQDASSATYAKILAFPQTAGTSNALLENPGWATNTAGAARLMQVQRFTSTDTPLWTGNLLDGTCVGFPAMSSEQLASGNLIFGSWGTMLIGSWGVLELAMDNGGTRFNQAQIGIRAMWMVDVLLRYPQAWIVGTNLS